MVESLTLSGVRVVRPLLRPLAFCALLLAVANAGHAQAVDPTLWVTNGQVLTTAIGDGRLYVGGSFSYVGPRTGGFAQLGTSAARPGVIPHEVNGSVRAMLSDGAGGWYIGGEFTRVAGVDRLNAAHVLAVTVTKGAVIVVVSAAK